MNYVISGSIPTVWASTYTVKVENKKGEKTIIKGYFWVEDLEEENRKFFFEQLLAEYCMEYGLFKERK